MAYTKIRSVYENAMFLANYFDIESSETILECAQQVAITNNKETAEIIDHILKYGVEEDEIFIVVRFDVNRATPSNPITINEQNVYKAITHVINVIDPIPIDSVNIEYASIFDAVFETDKQITLVNLEEILERCINNGDCKNQILLIKYGYLPYVEDIKININMQNPSTPVLEIIGEFAESHIPTDSPSFMSARDSFERTLSKTPSPTYSSKSP